MCLIRGDIVGMFEGLADGVKTGEQSLTSNVVDVERIARAARKANRPMFEGDGDPLTRMLFGKIPQRLDNLGINVSQ